MFLHSQGPLQQARRQPSCEQSLQHQEFEIHWKFLELHLNLCKVAAVYDQAPEGEVIPFHALKAAYVLKPLVFH